MDQQTLQDTLHQSPRVQRLAQLRSGIDDSPRQVAQRQRLLTMRSAVAPVMLKGKGPPLPGRKKRRKAEQDADIAEMQKENEQWEEGRQDVDEGPDPNVNPFALLENDQEQTATEPQVSKTKPEPSADPIAELESAGSDVQAIRSVLSRYYRAELIAPLSRAWRSRNVKYTSMRQLERAANVKRQTHEEESARQSPDIGSRRLNSTGTVSGLGRGRGSGWLAGDGAYWHVHYDHVKFGNDGSSRINFAKRKKATILSDLASKSNPKTGTYAASYAACVAYINTHL